MLYGITLPEANENSQRVWRMKRDSSTGSRSFDDSAFFRDSRGASEGVRASCAEIFGQIMNFEAFFFSVSLFSRWIISEAKKWMKSLRSQKCVDDVRSFVAGSTSRSNYVFFFFFFN